METEVEQIFLRSSEEREALWKQMVSTIESYLIDVKTLPVKRANDIAGIRGKLSDFTFESPRSSVDVLSFVTEEMTRNQTHFAHPAYFGLFDPGASPMGIAGDAMTALFNPQLASSMQSLFPIETERHLLRQIGGKLGLDPKTLDGCFTSGGAEANHTALVVALCRRFPQFSADGVRALPAQPVIYVSRESHHSFHKAARMSGLGDAAVRHVDIDDNLRMDALELRRLIREDREKGLHPLFVVGTAGTTKAGIVDPLSEIADIARDERMWFHVDGAWGAAASLSTRYRSVLNGIERADSITLDAHKWLLVPMAGGMFFTKHAGLLKETFALQTGYIAPPEWDVVEPYQASIQWSRRFIGLKLFMTLGTVGWSGYEKLIDHTIGMGGVLKTKLQMAGYQILNDTPLPVVCFIDEKRDPKELAAKVVASGKSWISSVELSRKKAGTVSAMRAALVNYRTRESDIDALVGVLGGQVSTS